MDPRTAEEEVERSGQVRPEACLLHEEEAEEEGPSVWVAFAQPEAWESKEVAEACLDFSSC